jgi:hypothetical protein
MRSLRSFQSNPQELQLIAPPGGYFKLAPVQVTLQGVRFTTYLLRRMIQTTTVQYSTERISKFCMQALSLEVLA